MIPLSQDSAGPSVDGLLVTDLYDNVEFTTRAPRAARAERHLEGLHRLAQAFVDHPESILQELAHTALEICGADSAGVTQEIRDTQGKAGLQWVAVAGQFEPFSQACFPFVNTACGTGMERGRPQLFRMDQRFYTTLGIEAEPVTDGILIPWRSSTVRGTVWIMAHGRNPAFDASDSRLMETLASFAALAIRQQRQRKVLLDQACAAASASIANELAHCINNPLQSLTNVIYLAEMGSNPMTARELAHLMAPTLERISTIVERLLALPRKSAPNMPSDFAVESSTPDQDVWERARLRVAG